MIQDPTILRAVTGIRQRSERQADQEKLVSSFVDAGIKPLVSNSNNQIVYGRRGTGKTHLLKVIEPEFTGGGKAFAIYIDARTLGSTSQFSDASAPLGDRCLSLFRDIFTEIYEALLRYIFESGLEDADAALTRLDELMATVTGSVDRESVVAKEVKSSGSTVAESGLSGALGIHSANVSAKLASHDTVSDSIKTTYAIVSENKVVFPELQAALRRLTDSLHVQLIILLDEWSSIPIDLQPYLAEFLKRSMIPNNAITLKIASLEHRSLFSLRDNRGNIVGLELGADISAGLDIDDYYVYDRNPKRITDIFADILYRHLQTDLGDYLQTSYLIYSGTQLVDRMFVSMDVFQELVRAAEGVVRDLINIFTSAFIHASRRLRDTIDRRAVLDAARQWYEQDKVKELGDDLRRVLEAIVQEVIGDRRARAFMISRDLEKHPVIQRLFDARVLHLMQRGYADKDNPGVRYNIYSIDYGTYVDLLSTSKAPNVEFDIEKDDPPIGSNFIVPFDDKRSIRRIVLPQAILDRSILRP